MRKNLLLFFLTLTVLNASAADYYWVGGGGSWSDLNHWRLGSSAGSIPSIVPAAADNVFFTNQSGFGTTAATSTVSLDANGFCNNMTWSAVPNSPSFNAANASFKVQVSGNLVLSPATTYNVFFAFKGATPATLTANGNVLGELGMEIDKPGSSLTLADNLMVPATTTAFGTGGTTLTSGTFDLSGKTVTLYNFMSDNTNMRTLQMTNANVTFNSAYRYAGLNKTLNATGSTLLVSGMATDGGTYNKATVTTAGGPNTNVINGTTFSSLTFTSTTQIYSDIEGNNTVDTLVFYGQGALNNSNNIVGSVQFNGPQGNIASNNTVQNVLFVGRGAVNGGNTIGTLTAQSNLQISGVNTIDSLLLAPNKTTTLAGTININKYMRAQGLPCQAFTEIIATDTAHLYFAPAATASIDNVNLTYIAAHGNITPIAVSGVDGDGNAGFNITEPSSLSGANLYWVGGAGDWNDNTHWSYSSGGPGGACIPFIADTVIFNSASGLGSSRIVTTSGNSYCYNMNWLAGVGTTTFNEAGASAMSIYGSVVLNSAVTMNAMLEFAGTNAASTITTNGSTLGSLQLHTRKKGAGAVTLLDNWSNPNNGILTLVSGSFNMPGRTISINRFTGNTNGVRSLDISNANITVSNTWAYVGANKTINATGSYINTAYALNVDGLSYPKIDATYTGAGNPQAFTIINTTFGALTFTGTNATAGVNIDSNNIVRRLEFKGAGAIAGPGNVIDTMIFAASRNYQVTGTSTINKYLLAQSPTCTGLLEMRGNTTGGFAFNPAANIQMANVYLQNMSATGVPAVAVSGADAGGNSGWNISSAAGTPRYWIGGAGDWNDNTHWSTASGGTGGACIPTVYDNVYFDANSGFTASSKTVTVNNGNAYCRNLDWSAATNAPVWNKAAAWNIEVWGDTTVLNAAATFTVSPLTFKGNNNAVISGSALGNFDIRMSKAGGSLRFLNNYTNILTDIYVNDGTLNLAGRTMSLSGISNEGLANTMSVNLAGAAVTLDTLWRYDGTATAHTLIADTSTINTETFQAAGMTYNKVNASGVLNSNAVFSGTTIGQLTFTNTNTASKIGINGTNNTIGILDYKGSGGIYGTGNTIDTLIFFPGNTYTLTNGTNTTITGEWFGSGTPCRLTDIVSSSASANATVTKTSGSVVFDYVRLRRITAAGAAQPFTAQQHTTDQGNNLNWNIAPYNGAAPIYGLGPDTALLATAFPYTLGTEGFFGVPSSQYTWNNSSTADSLVITDTGSYSVTVNFVDGCTISDTIHVSLRTPLPVTLAGFAAHVQNCQAYLDWKVTNAVNFSQFVVERSGDGRNFSDLARVAYASGTGEYAYVDKNIGSGAFYRLRLIDVDGRYQYSTVIPVTSDCGGKTVSVYPTVTNGIVLVDLPVGYEGAKIEVFTSLGQLVQLPNSDKAGYAGIHRISFNGLAQGQYLLRVSNGGEMRTFKLFYQP
ncbi:T9SS type A sorting domain-containing protein [Taibaiella koreensis]|uniref:T9SS type A sorting domain-containing protein n=1 Tax=Taibaiella koreensis TaxID=1268548 RepID=UPI000E59A1D1|nr:T9SS type A sorting domain-containing protein [Taibaiella koreensis]